ncbi:MAG: bifunctional folylpolyglutamate synthase/dihydrofolate synthase [Candidatus Omnitrophica bacterium]|nr:bifunctional folylpolyglutamate synthase/dihydrofolate synthase [Candidatus Omnitrophota bacterium]
MNYKEALEYLNSFINYEKIGYKDRRPFKLERMFRLAEVFDNPQDTFSSVHISGTKGKGSIASFTASILTEADFNVGLYTSPHLISPRERIRLNNEAINEDDFAFYTSKIKRELKNQNLGFSPTFFEIYTILAFNYFKAKKIDYGVVEVGLGGRLDATNIVCPTVSVISPISYDHTEILGEKLEKITREKSGIIKEGRVVVSAPQKRSVLEVIRGKCTALNAKLTLIGKDINFNEIYHDDEKEIFDIRGALKNYKQCTSYLLGRHQVLNATCSVAIAENLIKKGAKISGKNIKIGIEKTRNPGRCEVTAKNPYVILDGAQNRASAATLKETIRRNFKYKRLILILGISKEKDIKGVCEELSGLADTIILTKAKIERGEEPRLIKKFIKREKIILTKSVKEALDKASTLVGAKDIILVAGSFFVVGEAKTVIYEVDLVCH